MEAGNSTAEGIGILAILIIIILVTPKGPGSVTSSPTLTTGTSGSSGSLNYRAQGTVTADSPQARDISLGTGNASYAYQSYEEYITIDNVGRGSVDITGWQLKNGKDERAYDLGGALKYFSADRAVIPQAALFISPSGGNTFQNVVLESGETAVITTGSMGPQSPYRIVSFKENICSGYLEDLEEYTFTPPLNRSCPRPSDEPGVAGLDSECRRFVERMSSCRTPKFDTRTPEGDICRNCVNDQPLSSSCVAFIKNHFNYSSCIAYHRNDPDFSGRSWRIFLGRGWEMWAKEYETVSLFDQLGRLVSYRTY